jgi:hypothetical protein
MYPGATVDCVIGSQFLPNQEGNAISLPDRVGGTVIRLNEYGTWDVVWPNGETYSYETALLRRQ